MAKKSKLLQALDAHKGRDYEAEKKKKENKAAEKRKRQRSEIVQSQAAEDGESDQEGVAQSKRKSKKVKLDVPATQASSDSEIEANGKEDESDSDEEAEADGTVIAQPTDMIDASASEAEQESDVPLSDLEGEDMEDMVPHQRLTINNGPALIASRRRVTVAKPHMPFHYHNSLVSTLPAIETIISDPNDDLTRELEFYRIAREGAVTARSLLKKEKIPFTRPTDYFAEMVKTDEHMGKVKKKLYDEAAGKKASEEARKLRDAKKFGKAVQVAKEQERAKEKRTTLDNIKELKKRRKGQPSANTTEADDLFQEISVDNNKDHNPRKRDRSSMSGGGAGRDGTGSNFKRQRKDSKFGFGGKKRFSKSGDATSSADMSGFSSRSMKGRGGGGVGAGKKRPTTKRLGKSKRTNARS